MTAVGYATLVAAIALSAVPAPYVPTPVVLRTPPAPDAAAAVPRTPPGMAGCAHAMLPRADLIRTVGETVRYWVQVNGISVGTVDFQVYKNGQFERAQVTEYRSQFKLDALVASFIPVEGRAAALVPFGGRLAERAMMQFTSTAVHFEENLTLDADGRTLSVKRKRNETTNEEKRRFATPVTDFVTAFYWARSIDQDAKGCVLIYGNQRVYTVWVQPDGQEQVPTPVGARFADRYRLRYATEKSKQPIDAVFWLATDATRLPYRAEILGPNHVEATVHLFEPGRDGAN